MTCPLLFTPEATDAASIAGAQPSRLDAQALTQLALLDPTGIKGLLPRLLKLYLDKLASLLDQLDPARRAVDQSALRMVVHSLKSSSASMGALDLSALCAAAEQALREGDLEGLPTRLDALAAEALRVDAAVRQLLACG